MKNLCILIRHFFNKMIIFFRIHGHVTYKTKSHAETALRHATKVQIEGTKIQIRAFVEAPENMGMENLPSYCSEQDFWSVLRKKINEESTSTNQHGKKINEESANTNQHGKKRNEESARTNQHGKKINEESARTNQYGKEINEESARTDQHGNEFQSNGFSNYGHHGFNNQYQSHGFSNYGHHGFDNQYQLHAFSNYGHHGFYNQYQSHAFSNYGHHGFDNDNQTPNWNNYFAHCGKWYLPQRRPRLSMPTPEPFCTEWYFEEPKFCTEQRQRNLNAVVSDFQCD